jgi:predicted DsbA family dithiol-disulfide isomerase
MIEAAPGTILIYSDIACPWAHLAVYRLWAARARLGAEDDVKFDLHSFPLELVNERPTPKLTLEAEVPVAGALQPDAGWSLWTAPPFTYAVTTLLAMEAVHAAKQQGSRAAESLDRALRLAFFRDSLCISMHHVIVEIARNVEGLDAAALERDLIAGSSRRKVFEDLEVAKTDEVKGSPHLFAPGRDVHNPGIEMHWEGRRGGFPVIDKDDPQIYDDLIELAAG